MIKKLDFLISREDFLLRTVKDGPYKCFYIYKTKIIIYNLYRVKDVVYE